LPNVLRFRLQLDIKLNVSLVIRPHLTKPSLVSEEALTVSEEKAADLEKV
jgi:hypothetical protein